jgi:DUF4097 and DUF4098 domain-containing protein YvlB
MTKQNRTSKLLFSQIPVAIAFLLPIAPCLQAQAGGDRIAVPLTDPSRPVQLKAHLLNGGITVKGYDGKEVVVEARVRTRESSRAEGTMKRLQINSSGLTVEEENNQVRVGVEGIQRNIDLEISVPRRTSLNLSVVNGGNIVVSDVEGEFDVNNTNGTVTLTNIAGSAVAHAMNGRVTVSFTRVDPQKAMSFSSMNGTIDVTFPADLKANVSFRTDNGEVLSDFDVQMQSSTPQQIVEDGRSNGGRYRVRIDKTVSGKINGGGPEIQFKNFNGNIYIRKAGSPR